MKYSQKLVLVVQGGQERLTKTKRTQGKGSGKKEEQSEHRSYHTIGKKKY